MNIAVVPAKNEQGRISKVLQLLQQTLVDEIITVINGSTDNTLEEIKSLNLNNIRILEFLPELGIDVPRAIGAYQAYKCGASCMVFIDGDLVGNISNIVDDLVSSVNDRDVDLALTDCYPNNTPLGSFGAKMIQFRSVLNYTLDLYEKIGAATPSHGPHAISRRLFEQSDSRDFAVPPVILAQAVKQGLAVEIAAKLPQNELGSKTRSYAHTQKIVDTIIGDTIEAINYFKGLPRTRFYFNREYQGYNPSRRFDLLEKFLSYE